MPELSITEWEQMRLNREIEATIRRNRGTYQEREEEFLAEPVMDKRVKPLTPYEQAKADARRIRLRHQKKVEVKRRKTKLGSSKYYGK